MNLSNSMPILSSAGGKSQQEPISVGQITKDAWKTVLDMPQITWAMFLLHIPVTIIISQLPADTDGNLALYDFIHGIYGLLFSGFLSFGIYRATFRFKTSGEVTGMGFLFGDGLPFWWRNLKSSLLVGVYGVAVFLLALLLPGGLAFLASELEGESELIVLVLAGICLVVGLFLALRMLAGISLCFARLAEGRNSASEAIDYSSKVTKGRIPLVLGVFGMSVLYELMAMLVAFSAYTLADTFSDYGVSESTELLLDIGISLPMAFASVLTTVSLGLLYLRLSRK